MGLLDGLEKLINEHGSAAILKERIELANDKYAALERKAKALLEENSNLRGEVDRLRDRLQALEGDVAQKAADQLEKEPEQILAALAKVDDAYSAHLARALGMNEQVVAFHLAELEHKEMVSASYIMNQPTHWNIAHEGRRYLIEHGLLK